MANFIIPRKDIKKIDIIVESLTSSQVYNKYKPDYFINLALYDMGKSVNITNMEDENKKSGYLFSLEGIGVQGEKDLVWTTKAKAGESTAIRDFCGGSPTLVKNGSRYVNWGQKVGSHNYGQHYRSFIGFNDNNLFLVASDNKMTIEQEVKTCLDMSMAYAINVDGGQSCHLQRGQEIIKKSVRRNASWLLVYMNKESEKPKDEVVKKEDCTKIEYVIQKGDTLSKIAQKFGVPYQQIAKDNNILNPSLIRVGQKLIINK